jgi:hypothetical protein
MCCWIVFSLLIFRPLNRNESKKFGHLIIVMRDCEQSDDMASKMLLELEVN